MEQLEKSLEKVELKKEEVKSFLEPLYRGLRLVEDRAYSGGTGVKYWM